MNVSKLHRRHATQNTVRFAMSMAVLTAALLTTTLAVPALERAQMLGLAAGHGGWIADIRSYLHNPTDYFAQRSPGARGAGQLIQSKHREFKLPRNAVKPHEQVLSNVRYGSPVPPYIDDLVPRLAPFIVPSFSPSVPSVPGTPPPSIGPPPVVPVGPPNSNPGGTPAGTAVPESSTWLMLIWGMALIGVGLRSRQRQRANGARRTGFRAQI